MACNRGEFKIDAQFIVCTVARHIGQSIVSFAASQLRALLPLRFRLVQSSFGRTQVVSTGFDFQMSYSWIRIYLDPMPSPYRLVTLLVDPEAVTPRRSPRFKFTLFPT